MYRKFHVIRQHDLMQCGAACLAMICHHYGKSLLLEETEKYCHVGKRGVSLLGISEAAQELGFYTRAARFTLKQLCEINSPCILYWNQNHFVILYKTKKNKFYIADPGHGLLTYDIETFKKNWVSSKKNGFEQGIALTLFPTQDFKKDSCVKRTSPRKPLKIIATYLLRYKKHLSLIVIGLFLGCVLQLIMPFLTQCIVDLGIKNKDLNFIWLILCGELAIVVGRTVTDFIRRWLLMHISIRVNISLISDFFVKLLKLPMSFFEIKHMGDLMQRMTDHSRIQKFLTQQVLGIIFTILSFIVFGFVLLIYNNLIFFVFIIGILIYATWIILFLEKRKLLDIELFEKLSENQNSTFEFITTLQEIKLQDCCQRKLWIWEDIQSELFDIQLRSLKLQQTQEAGSIFLNEIRNIVITILSANAVINGSLTLGGMLAIQYIIGQLNSPVSQFISFIYSFQDVKLSLDRINEIHEKPDEDSSAKFITDSKSGTGIIISNLDFKYNKHSNNKTLNGINTSFLPQKVTAIVGASGSGKTTLIKLLLGYYSNYNGSIRIEGKELRDINLKHWRRRCGVVMQDGVIFSESIARNIAVDDSDINIDRLVEAAKMSCIYDFIMSLPLKFNTIIGRNGVGISQGQKQRILIARAIYRNPDYIFLDEATNSLDTSNERIIVENLKSFYKNKTVIKDWELSRLKVNTKFHITPYQYRTAYVNNNGDTIAKIIKRNALDGRETAILTDKRYTRRDTTTLIEAIKYLNADEVYIFDSIPSKLYVTNEDLINAYSYYRGFTNEFFFWNEAADENRFSINGANVMNVRDDRLYTKYWTNRFLTNEEILQIKQEKNSSKWKTVVYFYIPYEYDKEYASIHFNKNKNEYTMKLF